MNPRAELSVHGGLEVSHLTAITHAVDDQKNRRQQRRKGSTRRRETPEALPEDGADAVAAEDVEADADTPTVNYLA